MATSPSSFILISSVRTTPSPVSPCFRALRQQRDFPSSVFGPVNFWALLRLVSSCFLLTATAKLSDVVARGTVRGRRSCRDPATQIIEVRRSADHRNRTDDDFERE